MTEVKTKKGQQKPKSEELKVFLSLRESQCGECREELGSNALIYLDRDKGALCLSCADLDQLEFLPSGDVALTVRAKKYSKLYAVVLRWSRRRKRYERQGILVYESAIIRAEEECLKDSDARERRREREAQRREFEDLEYVRQFAQKIRECYKNCPKGVEFTIAKHACKKYSGRVGRCAAAKELDQTTVDLAVRAHIRHTLTEYDELLLKGCERYDARALIEDTVCEIMDKWSC